MHPASEFPDTEEDKDESAPVQEVGGNPEKRKKEIHPASWRHRMGPSVRRLVPLCQLVFGEFQRSV
ncbi:hypothetical protein [Cohnella laeviribosi]|uniref:hypothetical protein n=1 Tax=Cohnella laeviribosi TaxID=380174 RepID=UPI0012EC18E2|nr:hypothetical protein [Cohnella laeviribosi]